MLKSVNLTGTISRPASGAPVTPTSVDALLGALGPEVSGLLTCLFFNPTLYLTICSVHISDLTTCTVTSHG